MVNLQQVDRLHREVEKLGGGGGEGLETKLFANGQGH